MRGLLFESNKEALFPLLMDGGGGGGGDGEGSGGGGGHGGNNSGGKDNRNDSPPEESGNGPPKDDGDKPPEDEDVEDRPPKDDEDGPGPGSGPSVEIDEPHDLSEISEGDQIAFEGRAEDGEGNDLSDRIQWSAASGESGSGRSWLEVLPTGRHRITASVTDDAGNSVRAQVTIIVGTPTPPNAVTLPEGTQ
jgi:hypothetical protein